MPVPKPRRKQPETSERELLSLLQGLNVNLERINKTKVYQGKVRFEDDVLIAEYNIRVSGEPHPRKAEVPLSVLDSVEALPKIRLVRRIKGTTLKLNFNRLIHISGLGGPKLRGLELRLSRDNNDKADELYSKLVGWLSAHKAEQSEERRRKLDDQ